MISSPLPNALWEFDFSEIVQVRVVGFPKSKSCIIAIRRFFECVRVPYYWQPVSKITKDIASETEA